MTIKKALKWLKESTPEEWNEDYWSDGPDAPDLEGVDLKDFDFRGRTLAQINLKKADLRRANLSGCNLKGALLSEAKLEGAKLDSCDLRNSSLAAANLKEVDLSHSDLSYANLVQSDFTGCIMLEVILSNADLQGTRFDNAILVSAQIVNTVFVGTSFKNAILHSANLRGAQFIRCDCQGAELWKANMDGCDVAGAKGLVFDSTMIIGIKVARTKPDPWTELKRSYTGTKLYTNLLLLASFLMPYIASLVIWVAIATAQNMAIWKILSVTALPQKELVKVPVYELVLRLDKSGWYFVLAIILVGYNTLRAVLTFQVSRFRDYEEDTGASPPYKYHASELSQKPPRWILVGIRGSENESVFAATKAVIRQMLFAFCWYRRRVWIPIACYRWIYWLHWAVWLTGFVAMVSGVLGICNFMSWTVQLPS